MSMSTKAKSRLSLIAVFAVMVLNQNCGNFKEFSGNSRSLSSEVEENTDVLLNGDSIEMNIIEGHAFNISADTSLISEAAKATQGFYRWYKIEGDSRRVVAVNTTEHSKLNADVEDGGIYEAQYIPQNGQPIVLGKVKLSVVPELKIRLIDFTNRIADGKSDVDFAVMGTGPKNISYEWSFINEKGAERILHTQGAANYSILKDQINSDIVGEYYVTVRSEDVLSQSQRIGPVSLELGGAFLCTSEQTFENNRCNEKRVIFSELRIGTRFLRGSGRPSMNWNQQTAISNRELALIQDGVTNGGTSKAMRYIENNLGYFTWKMNRAVVPTRITLHPPDRIGHSAGFRGNQVVVYGSKNGTTWTRLNTSVTGKKNQAITVRLNGVSTTYTYIQAITNFTSGNTSNYITEIELDHLD